MSAGLFTFAIILALLLSNALFVAGEFAIVGVPRPSIERDHQGKNRRSDSFDCR